MRLGKIGARPLGGMVGMRMIKPNNVIARCACFPLDAHQFGWADVITVMRRIRSGVAAAYNGLDRFVARFVEFADEYATALVRIRLLPMLTHLLEEQFGDYQRHWIS